MPLQKNYLKKCVPKKIQKKMKQYWLIFDRYISKLGGFIMGGTGLVVFGCQCPSTVKIGKPEDLKIGDVSTDKSIRGYLKLYGRKLSE